MNQDQNKATSACSHDRNQLMARRISAWSERAEIADRQRQGDVMQAALKLKVAYEALLESEVDEPDLLITANLLRKRIEASEQHRTMAAEHGLNDEAIDATFEIQAMEKQLVELVRSAGNDLAGELVGK